MAMDGERAAQLVAHHPKLWHTLEGKEIKGNLYLAVLERRRRRGYSSARPLAPQPVLNERAKERLPRSLDLRQLVADTLIVLRRWLDGDSPDPASIANVVSHLNDAFFELQTLLGEDPPASAQSFRNPQSRAYPKALITRKPTKVCDIILDTRVVELFVEAIALAEQARLATPDDKQQQQREFETMSYLLILLLRTFIAQATSIDSCMEICQNERFLAAMFHIFSQTNTWGPVLEITENFLNFYTNGYLLPPMVFKPEKDAIRAVMFSRLVSLSLFDHERNKEASARLLAASRGHKFQKTEARAKFLAIIEKNIDTCIAPETNLFHLLVDAISFPGSSSGLLPASVDMSCFQLITRIHNAGCFHNFSQNLEQYAVAPLPIYTAPEPTHPYINNDGQVEGTSAESDLPEASSWAPWHSELAQLAPGALQPLRLLDAKASAELERQSAGSAPPAPSAVAPPGTFHGSPFGFASSSPLGLASTVSGAASAATAPEGALSHPASPPTKTPALGSLGGGWVPTGPEQSKSKAGNSAMALLHALLGGHSSDDEDDQSKQSASAAADTGMDEALDGDNDDDGDGDGRSMLGDADVDEVFHSVLRQTAKRMKNLKLPGFVMSHKPTLGVSTLDCRACSRFMQVNDNASLPEFQTVLLSVCMADVFAVFLHMLQRDTRRATVQKLLVEHDFINRVCYLFDYFQWGSDMQHAPDHRAHGPDCTCTPDATFKLQYLRCLQLFCEWQHGADFRSLLLTHAETKLVEELSTMAGGLDRSYRLPSFFLVEKHRCTTPTGLIFRIAQAFYITPPTSPTFGGVCGTLESSVRRAPEGIKVWLTHLGVVKRAIHNIFELAPQAETHMQNFQAQFDFLSEFLRFSPFAFLAFDKMLGKEGLSEFMKIVAENIVASSMFVRSSFASLSRFATLDTPLAREALDTRWARLMMTPATQYFLVRTLLLAVDIPNVSLDNVCCLNTVFIFFLLHKKANTLAQALQSINAIDNSSPLLLSKLKHYSYLWPLYYQARKLDRESLEYSSGTAIDIWFSFISELSGSDSEPNSLAAGLAKAKNITGKSGQSSTPAAPAV
eukprot:m.9354 g.9354  ORF g.9354 m.9354 type:complete len:1072 (+) comp5443_c0_seq1:153-3368(+)